MFQALESNETPVQNQWILSVTSNHQFLPSFTPKVYRMAIHCQENLQKIFFTSSEVMFHLVQNLQKTPNFHEVQKIHDYTKTSQLRI